MQRDGRPFIRIVCGALIAAFGVLWVLQGLDLLGMDGGMNGEQIWVPIGALAALIGLAFVALGVRSLPRR